MTGGDAGPEDGLEGNPKTSQVDSTGWVPSSTMYGYYRVILLEKNGYIENRGRFQDVDAVRTCTERKCLAHHVGVVRLGG
ncbi:hypothetical protein NEUTE1DRAFT_117822 [Neurospora tetrasperma FGSC 2508]|uniref:Uncharacterized protein n=1 Tax=Neurospora tetrasperma (strain FGSC 2508 / ATCC MYA-4615 / P0657) TaxID=510951 RepID=F8MU72_NEUT8|nr:uncharacterized protein NEUTE1DRAFT_117822 [Neurospora tetrasperma FGSC 2508]EGO55554.1 hypothetical protein NEUTE1DRAFT_117822 [Neurospora tetrasperma FGSC 2508]